MQLPISKFESAKKQLITAIHLYFKDDDPVSIHTLSAAAHGVLFDIFKKYKRKNSVLCFEITSKESRDIYRDALRKAQNFFKHADNDPFEIIIFNTDSTDFFLYDACLIYSELTKERIREFSIFEAWFKIKYDDQIFKLSDKLNEIKKYKGNKALFFKTYFPIF